MGSKPDEEFVMKLSDMSDGIDKMRELFDRYIVFGFYRLGNDGQVTNEVDDVYLCPASISQVRLIEKIEDGEVKHFLIFPVIISTPAHVIGLFNDEDVCVYVPDVNGELTVTLSWKDGYVKIVNSDKDEYWFCF